MTSGVKSWVDPGGSARTVRVSGGEPTTKKNIKDSSKGSRGSFIIFPSLLVHGLNDDLFQVPCLLLVNKRYEDF